MPYTKRLKVGSKTPHLKSFSLITDDSDTTDICREDSLLARRYVYGFGGLRCLGTLRAASATIVF